MKVREVVWPSAGLCPQLKALPGPRYSHGFTSRLDVTYGDAGDAVKGNAASFLSFESADLLESRAAEDGYGRNRDRK